MTSFFRLWSSLHPRPRGEDANRSGWEASRANARGAGTCSSPVERSGIPPAFGPEGVKCCCLIPRSGPATGEPWRRILRRHMSKWRAAYQLLIRAVVRIFFKISGSKLEKQMKGPGSSDSGRGRSSEGGLALCPLSQSPLRPARGSAPPFHQDGELAEEIRGRGGGERDCGRHSARRWAQGPGRWLPRDEAGAIIPGHLRAEKKLRGAVRAL